MAVKRRVRALQKRYGRKKGRIIALKKPKAYQVVVKEGSAAARPLKGMRLFDTKREGAAALRILAAYQDDDTRMSLKMVRK